MKILRFVLDKIFLILFSILILLFPPIVRIVSSQEKEKINISINEHKLTVEIADTIAKRAIGLMFKSELKWDEGMLFVFSTSQYVSFWMKDTKISLSLAFIDEKGVITEILDLKPYDLSKRTSKTKIKYALEVNQGWFKKKKIKIGDTVKGLP
ncbi:MAG: DUF192 domain-containing protein [Candidatus Firestonebacteria bacterium]